MLKFTKSILSFLIIASFSIEAYSQNDILLSPRSICWTGERIFVSDSGDSSIKEVDSDGRVMSTHGRRGSGPGEYQNIGLLHCGENGFYVSDDILKRYTYYPYNNLKAIQTYSFERNLSFNTELQECGNYICISGHDFNTKQTLHLYTKKFEYLRSIGDELEFINANPFIEYARHQLSQTEFIIPDDQTLIIIRPAPLEIVEIKDPYGIAKFTKTERHDLIPKPWETDHMAITSQTYRVGMYYKAHSISIDSSKRSMLVIYDVDEKHTVYEFDYKTNRLRKTGVSVPLRSLFSNLVQNEGQSKYFTYDLETEKLTLRRL